MNNSFKSWINRFCLLLSLILWVEGISALEQPHDKNKYRIVKESNISVHVDATIRNYRMSYSIVVAPELTDDDIKRSMMDVIQKASKLNRDIDEIAVFTYFREREVGQSPALARADWSPNGRWGTVTPAIAQTNDRRSYQVSYHIFSELQAQRYELLKPTSTQRKLHAELKPHLKGPYLKKTEVAVVVKAMAPRLGVSEEELQNAYDHVSVYDYEHGKGKK
jgi:hypothetical protein